MVPTGVTSTSVVVPVNILLLPAEKIIETPASFTNSVIVPNPLLVPNISGLVVKSSRPLRAPILPYWSITQLSAIDAKELSKLKGESCVFNPLKPGAATVIFCRGEDITI